MTVSAWLWSHNEISGCLMYLIFSDFDTWYGYSNLNWISFFFFQFILWVHRSSSGDTNLQGVHSNFCAGTISANGHCVWTDFPRPRVFKRRTWLFILVSAVHYLLLLFDSLYSLAVAAPAKYSDSAMILQAFLGHSNGHRPGFIVLSQFAEYAHISQYYPYRRLN